MNGKPPFVTRTGVALYLILALVLSVSVLALTWVFGARKVTGSLSFLQSMKSDYHMESAVLLNFHRIRNMPWSASEVKSGPEKPPHSGPTASEGTITEDSGAGSSDELAKWEPNKEVAPGLILKSGFKKITPESYKIVSKIDGMGLTKRLIASVTRRLILPAQTEIASDPQSASETVSAPPAFRWNLEFSLDQDDNL